jgi:general secretion pathway protein A
MSYYKLLGLTKEPFSTSPDPEFFFRSLSHVTALKRLEIAIRLRRGLSLVIGDVGVGKTTLLRTLLQTFNEGHQYCFHIVLDPGFKSEFQFLSSLVRMFGLTPLNKTTLDFKEEIEKYLFQKGVVEQQTIVLLIDEGQKLTAENIELLRTLLNFETNQYKLLQLIIMGQIEMLPRLSRIRNFMDRVALKYMLNPFDERETRQMIEYRLRQAGYSGNRQLFTDDALALIYQHTQGYPRRISLLCHDALEMVIMKDISVVHSEIIRGLISQRESITTKAHQIHQALNRPVSYSELVQ